MRKLYAKALDARAAELLKRLDLFSVPVNIEAVAEKMGARVVFEELDDDVSGLLLREKDVTTIAVNSHHHPNRQRFTIAHECGHLELHATKGDGLWIDRAYSPLFFRDAKSSSGEKTEEIQANQFAAGLLMPEELLRQSVESELSDIDIFRLAVRFQVSEQAMTLRLVALDLISGA